MSVRATPAGHRLGPEENARERRHLKPARLEFSTYAQHPRQGTLWADSRSPFLKYASPDSQPVGGCDSHVSWGALAFERRPLARISRALVSLQVLCSDI